MEKPVEFSRPRSVRNQHFKSAAHELDLFHMLFKKIELEPAIIEKYQPVSGYVKNYEY